MYSRCTSMHDLQDLLLFADPTSLKRSVSFLCSWVRDKCWQHHNCSINKDNDAKAVDKKSLSGPQPQWRTAFLKESQFLKQTELYCDKSQHKCCETKEDMPGKNFCTLCAWNALGPEWNKSQNPLHLYKRTQNQPQLLSWLSREKIPNTPSVLMIT